MTEFLPGNTRKTRKISIAVSRAYSLLSPSGLQDFRPSGHQAIRTSGLQDFRTSEIRLYMFTLKCILFRTSGLQDIRTSGHQDIRTSGHQDIRTSGHQKLSTSIYDLVLLDVCHFHHCFFSNRQSTLITIEILVLISWILHPGILVQD